MRSGAALVLAALTAVTAAPVRGQEEAGGFRFALETEGTEETTVSRTGTVVRFLGGAGRVVIPAAFDGVPVTAVGREAFFEARGVTEVEMPPSIGRIGEGAFYGCVRLRGLSLPAALETIEDWTFYGCVRLSRIEIPNSVRAIGKNAFGWCRSLTLVVIPPSVGVIKAGAFLGCVNLETVRLSRTTLLEENAFPPGAALIRQ